MKKRILTMFWYDDAGEVHLYKDVGGIPYALAKYCGWQATFAYNDVNGIIHNKDYEKYVKLDTIHYPKILCKLKLRYYKYFQVMKYVWRNAPKYDVINFYHCHKFIRFLCWLAKKANPNIITYVKLDMGKDGYNQEKLHCNKKHWDWTNLFSVETKMYVDGLNKLPKFKNKVVYLPNGFFNDFINYNKGTEKEKIILTVARIGDYAKNVELLVDALIDIEHYLGDWKIYLVGPVTESFKIWFDEKLKNHIILKNKIIFMGYVSNKQYLCDIYNKSSIFVLPSRSESWGLVISEAMYYSNYVIVTDCCDAYCDFIYDTNNCYGDIIENNNKEKLKQAILSAIENYESKIVIARQGSKFINKYFNWRVVAKNLEKYFMDINNEVVK